MRKVKFTQDTFDEKLGAILTGFPMLDNENLRPFIHPVAKDHKLKRAAPRRKATIMRRQNNPLAYPEQVRRHISRLPAIDPNTRTLLICGYPNVGKSSFISKVTRADVDVQPYAFTTKSLFVGYLDYKYLRWQVIDTPVILDHPLCNAFHSMRLLFSGKPTMLVINKIDMTRLDELTPENRTFVQEIIDAKDEDIIPEIMGGQNIADFIDPDIAENLDALEREEERLAAEGFYDDDESMFHSDDEREVAKAKIALNQNTEAQGKNKLKSKARLPRTAGLKTLTDLTTEPDQGRARPQPRARARGHDCEDARCEAQAYRGRRYGRRRRGRVAEQASQDERGRGGGQGQARAENESAGRRHARRGVSVEDDQAPQLGPASAQHARADGRGRSHDQNSPLYLSLRRRTHAYMFTAETSMCERVEDRQREPNTERYVPFRLMDPSVLSFPSFRRVFRSIAGRLPSQKSP
ncbi:hypothetical protein OF83DRAFT_1287458 [Amylostereum chailletii]|nr:hypothetical protein OF83DRAFT_1287458 [Amylostereum chailletii]